MAVDRKIYKIPVSKSNPSQWPCPTCLKGILKVDQKSFHQAELKKSSDAHSNDNWDPEWIMYTYSCLLSCTNPQCNEAVSSTGEGSVMLSATYDSEGEPWPNYEDSFSPKFFYPHLILFSVPARTPSLIKSEIDKSFSIFFASPPAAASHIRITIEQILNYLKIKKYGTSKKGTRFPISLHERIKLLPKKYVNLKESFFAIKWLGNTGSHPGEIRMDDVMDSYDILENILFVLFEDRSREVQKLVKKINKKKGPDKNRSKK